MTTLTQAQARALVEEARKNHHIDLLHRYDNEPPVPHCAVCGFTPEPCDGLILADALSASLAREEGLREILRKIKRGDLSPDLLARDALGDEG
jgi:hypothetical protein